MVVTKSVEGIDAFFTAVEASREENPNKELTFFVLFSGGAGADGKSWCPDCVSAQPVVDECLQYAPEDAVYIYCSVGGHKEWKDPNNAFRTHRKLNLKCVPTLLKFNTPQRLGEEECSKEDLVKMFFEG